MVRMLLGLLSVSAILLLGHTLTSAQEAKELPSIKEIMREANKPTGLYFTLQRDLNSTNPDWAEAATSARELTQLIDALAKSKPSKGDAESWKKLTTDYLTHSRALEQAILKKDRNAALAAGRMMAPALCTTCHKAHR